MKIIVWKSQNWGIEYVVRKSKWLLILYIIKVIILISLLFLIAYLSLKLKYNYLENNLDAIYITNLIWIIVWILIIYILLKSILIFVKFFYSVEIINETEIYKINMGLFFVDNISITNISNIQEVKAVTKWLIRVLLWISDVHIVEQRDIEKVIHTVDEWKKIADIITSFKDKLVKNKEN